MTADTLLRMHEVERKTGLDRATIYRRIKAGTFPPPLQIGPRRVAWPEAAVLAWQQSLVVGVKVVA